MPNQGPVTPGSAVANQLQDILTQRTADKHQQLVDSLGALNTSSELDNRAQNTKAISEERAARAADFNTKAANRTAQSKAITDYMAGPDFAAQPISTQHILKLAATDPEGDLFKSVINGMMTQSRQSIPDSAILLPNNKFSFHGKIVDSLPPGTKIERGFEPRISPQKTLYQFPDPNDPTKTRSHWLLPGEQPNDTNAVQNGTLRKGNVPSTSTKVVPLYDPKAYSIYKNSITNQTPNATAARQSALHNLLNSMPKEKAAVRKDVEDIMSDPQMSKMNVDDLVKAGVLEGDPDHVTDVGTMLGVVRGQQ